MNSSKIVFQLVLLLFIGPITSSGRIIIIVEKDPPEINEDSLWRNSHVIPISDFSKIQSKEIVHTSSMSVPENFDAREKWPQCKSIQKIVSQGMCSSSWAIAITSMLTDRTCITSNGNDLYEYSAEDLLTCGTTDKTVNHCQIGMHPLLAAAFIVQEGLVSGGELYSERGCKPYSENSFLKSNLPCEDNCTNTKYFTSYENDKRFPKEIITANVSSSIKNIQVEIMMNGPICAVMKITEHFNKNYTNAVYFQPEGLKLNASRHAVKLIGWGLENRTPYWLAANSWGGKWGNLGGFFKVLRGNNALGIENEIVGMSVPLMEDVYNDTESMYISKFVILFYFILYLLVKFDL